jgi:hypothetical protein
MCYVVVWQVWHFDAKYFIYCLLNSGILIKNVLGVFSLAK